MYKVPNIEILTDSTVPMRYMLSWAPTGNRTGWQVDKELSS